MTPKEALHELGLESRATLDDVRSAYRRRARETHPDMNRGDPAAARKFQRVQAAYERLKQHFDGASMAEERTRSSREDRHHDDHHRRHARDDEEKPKADPVELVRGFMTSRGIVVLADGFLENTRHIKRPATPQEFRDYLLQPDVTVQSLVDDMMLDTVLHSSTARSTLATAVRKVIAADAKARTSIVFKPLLRTLGTMGHELMLEQLSELAALIFKGPSRLIAIGLLQFVWQVHRKMFGYEVNHHVMPVIWSAAQGTGKSTFVRHFCAPLKELFSPPITMEDFIDTRFTSALDYATLFVDEIPPLTPLQVDALKGLITSEEVLRRQLGTSKKLRVRQRSSAIGTANGPVERYFPDPSGHRRFLSIEMVDGRQHPEVWDAIKGFDFERVWRMYKATDIAPILPVVDELRAYQAGNAPLSPLLKWLVDVDLDAKEMKKIRRSDGYRADDLRKHFNDTMSEDWSRPRFSGEMARYFAHPLAPFGGKHVVTGITYYRLKAA
jgi:hypothetical protein